VDHNQAQAGSYLKDKLGLQNCHIITFIEILVEPFAVCTGQKQYHLGL
jgi:hypothetical protein